MLLCSVIESDPKIKGMFDVSWYIFSLNLLVSTLKPNSTDEVSRCKRKIKKEKNQKLSYVINENGRDKHESRRL